MKTKVYFNFNKKCFSIQQNGRVVGYRNSVCLKNCTFKVSEAGRQRVLREKRKNVHAYVVGELTRNFNVGDVEVTYNPYVNKKFVLKGNSEEVSQADLVRLEVVDKRGKIYIKGF